ncbi:tailspike protein [Streptomyces phage Kradal]|nr:tailspike protein [Streptomyces phage Kradal]
MPLPPERVVTGTYVNPVNGEPYDGSNGDHYLIFEPVPDRWTDRAGNQILLGGGKVTLDENGHFSEDLVCTDAADVYPVEGRLWRVRQFVGGSWDSGTFALPEGDDPLDITDILSVDICGVDYVPVPGPPGPQGPPGPPDGPPGPPGPEGASAYEVAVEQGFSGTEDEWLASLQGEQGEPGATGGPGPQGEPGTPGEDGPSAYQVALDNGFVGTEAQWLASLQGPAGTDGAPGPEGDSAYEVAVENGFEGSEAQWLISLRGAPGAPGDTGPQGEPGPEGPSAYEVAVSGGFSGTEAEWLASLVGPEGDTGATGATGPAGDSAYQVALDEGFVGTEEEWLASLVGPQGPAGRDGGMDTGISLGGDITANETDPLAVVINPLTGRIVDYFADPVTITDVEVTSPITVTLDSVAQERTITWLLMDADQIVYQQQARPSPEDRRSFLVLGMVAQDDGEIFLAQSIPTIARQPVNQLYDLMDAIGAFGIMGNDVSPNGANLQLNVGAGQVFSRGWNHFDGGTETINPHIVTTLGATPASWTHALRSSDLEHASASTTVDVGHYDLNGTLTAVGGDTDTSVVHQLWMFPTNEGSEVHILQYGQQLFDTLEDAISGAGTAAFVTNTALPGNAIMLGYLAVRGVATDLSDAAQAMFIKAGKFGASPGGGASVDLSGYAMLAGAEFTGQIATNMAQPDAVAQSSRVTTNGSDSWRRQVDGEMQWGPGDGPMDAFLRRLGIGMLAFLNTDLLVGQEDAKSYRFRQSGTSLDLDASGADLFLSVFELVNFLGEQYTYLRLESGEFTAHASGKWVFGDGPFDGAGHTLDGTANQAGFFGATPVGQQTVSGARTTGAGLQSLLDALEALGLIVDSTTAGVAVVETVNGQAGPDVSLTASDVGVGDVIVAANDSRNKDGADFVCTGTNDHLVIQQAIDLVDAAPGKGTVRLLDGTFWLGATVTIPSGAGLNLTGTGWGTVLKISPGVEDYAITFDGDETRARFSHFRIDGNLSGQTAGPCGGIWAAGAVECVFQHINFSHCWSAGLVLTAINGGAFGHNNYVLHCLFDNGMTSTEEGNGIYLSSSDENFIVACDFQFLGGAFGAGGAGIYDQAGTQTILGCNFVGGGNSLPAIRVQDASATKITACNFDGVGGDAVFLAATNCLVEGNTIFGVGAIGTAGTFSGIHLEYGATGNLIANNSISSHTVNGAARSLIREESVGDSGNNLVVGNMLITKGTLSVGALDLNAPGTIARSNFGGGADGDPVVTTDMIGVADGVASLDATGKVPAAQMPDGLVTSVNGEDGDVTLTAADVGALDEAAGDARYTQQDALYLNAKEHGAVGDETTDDSTVINALLSTSPAGSTVVLPPGTYGISVPLVVPPGKTLMGLRTNLMQITDVYDPQVSIKPLAGFTGVAAVRFLDQATGGYDDISGEQRLIDIMLDGSALTAGVDGLQAKGNIQNVGLRDVTIRFFPNSGIYSGLEGGIGPYSWRMHRVMLDNNHAHGMYAEKMVDLTMVDCQAIGNWSNGFMLNNAANSQAVACRAEWSGNHGFYLTGDWGDGQGSGGMLLSACSTDRNGFNGVFIDSTGNAPIVISNLMTRRDGRNGGTGGGGYAGLAVNAAEMPVIVGDWTNYPGVDDNGASTSSPDYGASVTGSTHVQIDNAYLHAATAGLNDGGGNTALILGANITYATGATTAPVRAVQQLAAARIPDLAASKVTSGTFDAARIPDLAASKVTSGTFDAARIPALNYVPTGSAVLLTGAQTVGGLKTFSSGLAVKDGTNAGDVHIKDSQDVNLLVVESSNATAAAGVMKLIAGQASQAAFLGTWMGAATNAWSIRADGRLEAGDGATGRDTYLTRTAAGVWQVTSQIRASASAPANAADLTRKDYVDGLDTANVKLTGAQTVAGIKTFSSIPVGPASNPTTDSQLARKAYVDQMEPNGFAPDDIGLLAWSSDPACCVSTPAFCGVGVMRMTAVVLHTAQTVGKIVWYAGGYAGGLLSGSWAGIWNAAGTTRLAGVAAMHTGASEPAEVHNAGGAMHYAPLDGGSVSLAAGVYLVAWRHVYTASPADGPMILQYENAAGSPPNTLALNTVKRFGYITSGASTLPSSISGVLTDGGNRFWVGLAT